MSPGPKVILNRLIAALSRAEADPSVIAGLLADIRISTPSQAEAAEQFVRSWQQLRNPQPAAAAPASTPLPPAPAAPPSPPEPIANPPAPAGTPAQTAPAAQPSAAPFSWGHGTVAFSAGALASLILANRTNLENWLSVALSGFPFLKTLPGLSVAAGVAGGLGGLLNAYLADTRLVLPRFQTMPGDASGVRRFFPGFLGNAAAGVGAAAVAVLFPIWSSTSAPAAGAFATTLVSAFLAGLAGSRVFTGQLDKNLLWTALRDALGKPANEARSHSVATAESAPEAFLLATGRALPGAGHAAPSRDIQSVEDDLVGMLDKAVLARYFGTLQLAGKPPLVAKTGAGLPLGVLKSVQDLRAAIPDPIKDMRLTDVAKMDLDGFQRRVTAAGMDVAGMQSQLQTAWTAARTAQSDLNLLPATWQLTPDRLR